MIESQLLEPVIERLKTWVPPGAEDPLFAGWKVEHFPDAPDRYAFNSARQELLLSYERSSYEEPHAQVPLAQRREVEFSVTVLVRAVRGPTGALAAIDGVRRVLMGWRAPFGGGPCYLHRDDFVGEEQGVWRFVVVFRARAPVVSAEYSNRSGPTHTQTSIAHGGCSE